MLGEIGTEMLQSRPTVNQHHLSNDGARFVVTAATAWLSNVTRAEID